MLSSSKAIKTAPALCIFPLQIKARL